MTSDTVTSLQGTDTFVNTTTYYYNADATGKGVTSGGTYMGGAVTLSSTAVTKNGTSQTGSTTTNTLVWWGGAMQSLTNYDSGSTHNTSSFNYDQSGHLKSVYVQDGRPRTISFVTDVNGQILIRDEDDNRTPTNLNGAADPTYTGDPKEIHYYFNGMGVGDISNNGTSDVDYVTSIAQHTATAAANTGAFRGGSVYGTSYADFDQSYDPINGLNYASTSSRYVVQGGDTLSSIAQAVWGDASFWYLIADANGLDGTETLVTGQSLILPNKVHNSHNNTSTYRVYDPNEAIGDTAPTAVAPPKDPACGGFGAILLGIIAIVVTAIVAPEL
ncbi:LysM peptidoglycan-binding domain-containing protein, partial [Novosphingobium sp. AAP93]|uniref:LysM peptidoglycan-binding domain-containing protein n=1 Tax=Novosphingobium sp. AAP93 TaxID=1523427 RepID=UPI0006B9F5C4